ncbi:putative glycoside hydrolase [Sorangium sp. So ce260]|uniref:putative glycoside hydrolase n=1 Tax=Sorangium sp. So ce260 TaxID=3133291 RepID=UPI003F5DF824
MPTVTKAIYVNFAAGRSADRMNRLSSLVQRTELNSLVIDVRSDGGALLLESDEATRGHLEALRHAGIYLIARLVAFKGGPRGWYDPGSEERWREIAEISLRAFDAGFDEVNYDYVRYGAAREPRSRTPIRERAPTIRAFFEFLRAEVGDAASRPISADLFGITLLGPQDGVGQRIEDAVELFDYVMPMPYPSHWGPGSFGLANPAHHPYETVHASLSAGWRRVADLPGRIALLRSWVQAFDLDSSRPMRRYKYTPWHIREQIRAIDDAGCAGYAAWNPRSAYEESAFLAAAQPEQPDPG